jgi:predicted MFS family arabinose efflux permease
VLFRSLSGATRLVAITAMVVAFTAQGFASWGLPLHVIRLFEDLGLDHGTAVTVAAVSGAAALAARVLEVVFGHRLHPLTTTGLAITMLTPMLALLCSPLDPLTSAWIFIVVWSGANGILAVLRMTLPLSLFGAAAYGTLVGRMSLPQNLAFAAAPAVFAVVIDRGGPTAALWLAIGASLTALIAAVVLARIARPARTTRPH